MKEKNGEHPFGDAGQLILLGVFLAVWVADSFFLHQSTFLSDHLPLWIRLLILGLALVVGMLLFKSGHVVVELSERPEGVMVTGAFRYVRHPLYLASILTYLGLTVSTMSIFSFVLGLSSIGMVGVAANSIRCGTPVGVVGFFFFFSFFFAPFSFAAFRSTAVI